MASEAVQACLVLSESDSNKPHLRGSNVLRLTADALALYACNAPRLTATRSDGFLSDSGGGGSDPACAQLCVQLLLQMSFCFPNQREWRLAVEQQCPGLQRVLLDVKELPSGRSLDMHSMISVGHLLNSFNQPALPQITSASSSSTAARKHVMLSYSWGAKKELVVALAAGLRDKGVDVWRDEEGSQCVPAMSGSTGDCMAAAIEHSHTIIVCVSRAYKASANCRMEAKYASDMQWRGKIELLFVMMEQDYTTRSAPEHVDGWLGLMIGDQLWHSMWVDDQVSTVTAAIHRVVGPAALNSPPATNSVTSTAPLSAQPSQPLSPSPPSAFSMKRPAHLSSSPAKSARLLAPASCAAASSAAAAAHVASPHVQSPRADVGNTTALAVAFDCVQDTNKARDATALADLLQSLGVTCAEDLAFLDDATSLSVKDLLKPAAANLFASNMKVIAFYHSLDETATLVRNRLRADLVHRAAASEYMNTCLEYLHDVTKHVDAAAMAVLLQQLGLSQPHELQYVDDAQLRDIVALLKPVAAKVFAHMMGLVRRSL